MIRTFIAIDLSDDVRAAIEEAQTRLKQSPVGVKITPLLMRGLLTRSDQVSLRNPVGT